MTYTIKKVSEITKVSEHTIRFWDKKGLFMHLKRGKNGVRYFSEQDLQLVSLVQCFRELDLSLEKIKYYLHLCLLGDESLEERFELIKAQRDKAKNILQNYKNILEKLENKVKIYEKDIKEKQDRLNPYAKNYKGKSFHKNKTKEIPNPCSKN